MSIYLGGFGKVMLQRKTAQGDLFATINTDDVNTSKKRFSFDEADELITGDQIEISTTNSFQYIKRNLTGKHAHTISVTEVSCDWASTYPDSGKVP